MTTILNGTEFVMAPAQPRRTSETTLGRTGIAVRRSSRRNRRNARAI